MSSALSGFSVRRLRVLLITLYGVLLIPSGVLFWQALQQIEWDVFLAYQDKARGNLKTIDASLQQWIERENRRPAEDYQFAHVLPNLNAPAAYIPGPLSAYPNGEVPGLIGYFEIDAKGLLTTPVLPAESDAADIQALPLTDREAREQLRLTLVEVLTRNPIADGLAAIPSPSLQVQSDVAPQLELASGLAAAPVLEAVPRPVAPAAKSTMARPAEELSAESQSASSVEQAPELRLALSDLALERSQYQQNQKKEDFKKKADLTATSDTGAIAPRRSDNRTVPMPPNQDDALRLVRLNDGHLLLYRTQWQRSDRKVQGMLLDADAFLREWLIHPYRQSDLSTSSQQVIAYRGAILSIEQAMSGLRDYASSKLDTAEKARQTQGILIHQGSLSPPFQDFEIAYSVSSLPSGPGTLLIQWSGGLLILLLSVGFWLLMRLGKRQLALIHQQRDFVAAVSHELKTPLTSIRMYSELLDQGWVSDDKKKTYYTFILRESERLSRLINNVLVFSKMGRTQALELTPMTLDRVQSIIQSVAEPLTEAAGFVLRFDNPESADKLEVAINPDGLQQITVNLIDNAIKFSAQCEMKTIEVSFRQHRNDLMIGFRDYGPGIPHDQAKKIFDLFYRGERELTRKTTGTGIGLALVRALAENMGAEIEAIPQSDGLEMRLRFAVRHG